jgi:hypothetical protein
MSDGGQDRSHGLESEPATDGQYRVAIRAAGLILCGRVSGMESVEGGPKDNQAVDGRSWWHSESAMAKPGAWLLPG